MMFWNRLKYLWPPHRRREERDMREELESLAATPSALCTANPPSLP